MYVSSRFGRIVSNYCIFFPPAILFRKDGIGTARKLVLETDKVQVAGGGTQA